MSPNSLDRLEVVQILRSRSALIAATLAEAIVGLGIFGVLSLAVVGVLIQTANLDKKDTALTESTFLLDSILEQRVAKAREYSEFDDLESTPVGEYLALDPGRADSLQNKYLYRVDIEQPVPALKKIVVSIYYREPGANPPIIDLNKGQRGRAVSAGTVIGEPSR